MPMRSQAQRGAMYAAAAGNSTLGIPQAVGQEFAESDVGGKLPAKAPKEKVPTKMKKRATAFGKKPADYAGMVMMANKYAGG
jgi:hypothetical protein